MFTGDILQLQLAWSEDCFNSVTTLFIEKWESIALEADDDVAESVSITINHFKHVWLKESVCNWYRGAAEGHPMNNNGLESTNGTLKDEVTSHLLMPFEEFLGETMKWFTFESLCRKEGGVKCVVNTEPSISRTIYEQGYKLYKASKFRLKEYANVGNDDITKFWCRLTGGKLIF